jgi:hypothetical protein
MLFHQKTKKVIRYIWIVLGVMVIASMVLLYAPIF